MRFARLAAVLILATAAALRAQCPAFSTPLYYANDVPAEPRAIATADFDGDGNADLAIGGKQSNTVLLLFGNGDGTFSRPLPLDAKTVVESIVPADLNGDGKMDLAVATIDGIVIFINQPGGSFTERIYHFGLFPGSIAVADFNRDGN